MTPWIVFAFVFLIYMCTCLPNTRGKTFDEIQEFMNGSLIKRNIKFIKTKTDVHVDTEFSNAGNEEDELVANV